MKLLQIISLANLASRSIIYAAVPLSLLSSQKENLEVQ